MRFISFPLARYAAEDIGSAPDCPGILRYYGSDGLLAFAVPCEISRTTMIRIPIRPNPAVTQISGEVPPRGAPAGRRLAPFGPPVRAARRRSCLLGGAGASVLLVKGSTPGRSHGLPIYRGQPDAWTRDPRIATGS